MRNGYRTVRADDEPQEWNWNGETRRLEPLEADDPSWFRVLLSLGIAVALGSLTYGLVRVAEMLAGRR
jgi:hypothetical protein